MDKASDKPATQSGLVPLERLRARVDIGAFGFETTDELEDLAMPIGQERALDAIRTGLRLGHQGYNIFAAGPQGTGKHETVRGLLSEEAATRAAPADWCYVNNFQDSHQPNAIQLPSNRGCEFKNAMDRLVSDLQSALSSAFRTDEYRTSLQMIEEELKERQEAALEMVRNAAAEKSVSLIHTPMGYAFAPMAEGRVIAPEKFRGLPQETRRQFEESISALEQELQAALQNLPAWLQETREKVRRLNEDTAKFSVQHLIRSLIQEFQDLEEIVAYLDQVQQDVSENVETFLGLAEQSDAGPFERAMRQETDFFRRYQVNLLVDHSEANAAPVVYEDEPSFERLMGRVEHRAELGALVTDFNMIRPGALHRANGGYLILDARKVLTQPMAWEALKRTLKAGEIRIESMYSALGLPTTTTLDPEPIPLDVKIVLIGEGMLYYLLYHHDPEFSQLFKILGDFDERIERTGDNAALYARLIATVARRGSLSAFDRGAVAELSEYAARRAQDSERFSTEIDALADVMREANLIAANGGASVVGRDAVQAALDAQQVRHGRASERIREQMLRGTVLVDTEGEKVGQINGLAVYMLGASMFGKPNRITARVRLGKGNVVDIEREVELGGPTHSKGVLILSGYLGSHYLPDRPLSLAASLVFEQSYGGVDGDSASSAELYALLSALADVPVKQHFAVTGSVNQRGEVQAIGGVNEKIEGFFDLCEARGLSGDHGVLIPASNVKNLMLDQRVLDAVEAGKFQVHAVETINQGLEILTGMTAGERDDNGDFPEGSVNQRVAARLADFAQKRAKFAGAGEGGDGS